MIRNPTIVSSTKTDETGNAVSVALVFAIAYLALALGDTVLLAPSRAVAAEVTPVQDHLDWVGSAAYLAQFDSSD